MPDSVFCHACTATTTSDAQYSNSGDRVCPACESDFIEITEIPAQPAPNTRARRTAGQAGRNQGFHRHFTTPGGHNVHLHVVTSMGGIPGPLERLLNNAEPADLAALLQNMQSVNLRPLHLPPGVSAGDYGPSGGAAFDDLMLQLMEAHQPQASPTSRDALTALPRRKVRPANTPSEGSSNTPSDQPAACACGEPCSVCHDGMDEGSEVVELPCQHCYHEDCITAWLKDHNTCPVCRKELPVDQELQQQQQQERQQRLQQEVQRQPAGLQSLFGALNPFRMFGGGQAPAPGQQAGANGPLAAVDNGAAVAAGNAAVAGPERMPAGTIERLENVQSSLRELETRLLHQIASANGGAAMFVDRQTLEDELRGVQTQNARLQAAADTAMEALHMGSEDQSPRAGSPPAYANSDTSGIPDLVESNDEDEDRVDHGDDGGLNLITTTLEEDLAEVARAGLSALDGMPALVTIDDDSTGNSSGLPDLESDHGDDLPGLESDHDDEDEEYFDYGESEYESSLSGDDDDLPALVHVPPRFTSSVTNLSHAPLTLDEQDAVDKLSHELEASEVVVASSRLVADEAVMGDRLQMPASEQAASPTTATASAPAEPLPLPDSPEQDSAERRVVQRINSHSTPQNPSGPLQSQPSGLALATAPVSNPEGVIVNERPISPAGIESELPRTASRPESDTREDKNSDLRSHPITHTPSRKRSFTPSEASSAFDASPSSSLARDSLGGGGRPAERSTTQRSGGLLGPVTWAARGAGRIMGSLLRRNSRSRQ